MVSPWAKNGRTRRSGFTPTTPVVLTVPSGLAVMSPKATPLARSARVTGVSVSIASATAASRMARKVRGHLVGQHLLQAQAEQVGRVAAVGPGRPRRRRNRRSRAGGRGSRRRNRPDRRPGWDRRRSARRCRCRRRWWAPDPALTVNLRWKICRPRRTARNGSRLMMNSEVVDGGSVASTSTDLLDERLRDCTARDHREDLGGIAQLGVSRRSQGDARQRQRHHQYVFQPHRISSRSNRAGWKQAHGRRAPAVD